MIAGRSYLLILLWCIIPLTTYAGYDQSTPQDIDNLLNNSINSVYQHPEDAIKLGQSVYNNSNYNLKTRVQALMLIALAHSSKRDYQSALDYTEKANKLSEELDNPKLQLTILFKIGILYQQLKVYDKSLEYIEKAEQMSSLYPEKDPVRKVLANCYAVKGFIYKENLNCDIALDYFEKSIAEFLTAEGNHNTNLSIVYYNKGNCNILQSNYNEARDSFKEAIHYGELEDANSLIAFAQKGMAEVYMLEDDYEGAIVLLQESLKHSSQVGDLVLNLGIYKGLYETYLALNHWENHQKYYDLFLKTQLQIKDSERNSISDSIDRLQLDSAEQTADLKSSFYNYIIVIATLTVLIFTGLILLERKNRKQLKTLKNRVKTLQDVKLTPTT